jgi:hypothetical protein
MMKINDRFSRSIAMLLTGLLFQTALFADVSASKGMFSQGRSRGTIYGSSASAFNNTYFVLGLGYGYYIFNGLQLGVDAESWLGASPYVYKVTPQMLYVVRGIGRFFPYLGGFYRRTFIEGKSDQDSYGGRAGIYTMMNSRVYAGVGVVYEQYAKCDSSIFSSCSTTYPEVNISVGF